MSCSFLVVTVWLSLCISSVNYWKKSVFSYSSWQLPKLCETELDIERNTFICVVSSEGVTLETRGCLLMQGPPGWVLEICSKEASQMGREDKSPPVKCHVTIGESKEVTSSSSTLVPLYKESFDNTWLWYIYLIFRWRLWKRYIQCASLHWVYIRFYEVRSTWPHYTGLDQEFRSRPRRRVSYVNTNNILFILHCRWQVCEYCGWLE